MGFTADGLRFERLEPSPQGFAARLWDLSAKIDTPVTPPGISHTQAGYLLLSRDGNLAVYTSARGVPPAKGVPPERYALVLIDLSLAGLSGAQLSKMMLSADPAVRLILMSGYPFDTTELSAAGPDRMAFLHKPFTPALLAETVDRLMRARPTSDAN